jgi:hypothetical protein
MMSIKPGEQVRIEIYGVNGEGLDQSKLSLEIYGLDNALANSISNEIVAAVNQVIIGLQQRKAGVETRTR